MPRGPPKRKLLKYTGPRAVWDPLHPGEIAPRIRPEWVDRELIRYQVVDETPRRIYAYCRMPSEAQKEQNCYACKGSRHNPKNETCTGQKSHVRNMKKNTLYSFKDPATIMEGQWVRVELILAPRYASGIAVFKRA